MVGAGDKDIVIHDGQGTSFHQSHRFVCSFIAHFSPFLPTLIILVNFFNLLTQTFIFAFSNVSSFSYFYSATIQLLKVALSSFASSCLVLTNEQKFMSPFPVLALLDLTTIFLTDA